MIRRLLCLSLFLISLARTEGAEETKWDFPLGSIGGTYRIHTGEAFVRVHSVQAGAPGALAGLQADDYLLGVGGVPFSPIGDNFQGLVRELGAAIELAESTDGTLPLDVLRPGVGELSLVVQLPVLGALSPAFPLESPKWQTAYEHACTELNTRLIDRSGNIGYPSGWAGLALLGHPNWNDTTGATPFRLGINACRDYYKDLLERALYAPVEDYLYDNDKSEGGTISENPNFDGYSVTYLENWWLGLGTMFLAEYYAKTAEPEYLTLLQSCAEKLGNRIQWWRQPPNHSSGHSPLRPGMVGHSGVSGDYMHYSFGGGINVVAIHVSGGLAMAKQAGVDMSVAPIDGRYFGFDPEADPATLPAGMTPRDSNGDPIAMLPVGFEDRQPSLEEKLGFVWDFYKNSQSTNTGHVAYAIGTGSYHDSGARTPGALFTATKRLGGGVVPDADDTQRMDLLKSYVNNHHDIYMNAHAMNSSAVAFMQMILPELGTRERRHFMENWRFFWTLMRQPDGTLAYMSGREIGDSGGYQQDLAHVYAALPYSIASGGLDLVAGYDTADKLLVDFSKVDKMTWKDLATRKVVTKVTNLPIDLAVTDGAGSPASDYTVAWTATSGAATFTSETSEDTAIQFPSPGNYQVEMTVTSTTDPAVTSTEPISISVLPVVGPGYIAGQAEYKVYTGVEGSAVADLIAAAKYPDAPDLTSILTSLEGTQTGSNFGATLTTTIIPAETGVYRFYIASDDASSLRFNAAGADPSGAVEIASVDQWTSQYQWDKYASQESAEIALTAGQHYYLQAIHKEGGGAEPLAVGWITPSNPTITVIDSGYIALPVAIEIVAITTQPLDQEIELGDSAMFVIETTGPQPASYQWRRDGENLGAPQSTPELVLENVGAWLGGIYDCVYTSGDTVLTSEPALLTLTNIGQIVSGGLWQELFTGIDGSDISDLTSHSSYPELSGSSDVLTTTSTGSLGNSYGQRWSGWLVPSDSGRYRFFASGDDATQLFLSPSRYEAHKQLIHSRTGYTSDRSWSSRSPSEWIDLVAGERYFVEFFHKEGGGGDHAAFTWQKEGDPLPANGGDTIPAANLEYAIGGAFPDAATAPPHTAPDEVQVVVGQTIEFDPLANDADFDFASLIITNVTAGASITTDGKRLIYSSPLTQSGSISVTYTLQNAIGLTAEGIVTITPVTLRDGLLGHWRFDSDTDAIAIDSTGSGHDGTFEGAPALVQHDPLSMAVQTSDGGDRISINEAVLDGLSDSVTVSFWANPTSLNPTQTTVLHAVSAGGVRLLNIHLPWSGSVYWDAGDSGGYDRIDKAIVAADYENVWTHWVFTKDANSGEMAIYINGTLWHSGTGKTREFNTSAEAFTFGAATDFGNRFTGGLDDLRLFDRSLSATEIVLLNAEASKPEIGIFAADTSVSENPLTTTDFTVWRDGDTALPVDIDLLIGGTATSGGDYLTLSQNIFIPAGAASAEFTLTPLDDQILENTESISIRLIAPASYRTEEGIRAEVSLLSDEQITMSEFGFNAADDGLEFAFEVGHELADFNIWWTDDLVNWNEITTVPSGDVGGLLSLPFPAISSEPMLFFKWTAE